MSPPPIRLWPLIVAGNGSEIPESPAYYLHVLGGLFGIVYSPTVGIVHGSETWINEGHASLRIWPVTFGYSASGWHLFFF